MITRVMEYRSMRWFGQLVSMGRRHTCRDLGKNRKKKKMATNKT
jgi:hypothetical protein